MSQESEWADAFEYNDRILDKSEPIKIFSVERDFMGIGYPKRVEIVNLMGYDFNMPIFDLNGEEIPGCSCWWIPEKEAKEVEGEFEKNG